jgi:hypothetical protein
MATTRKTAAQRRADARARQKETIRARRVTTAGDDPSVVDDLSRPELGVLVRRLKVSTQVRLTFDDGDSFHGLMGLAHAREVLDGFEAVMVEGARRQGLSWDDIGFALGVSGEAARKRLGRFDPDD